MADPRGGVRHVIPENANYVRDAVTTSISTASYTISHRALVTGGIDDPLLPQLKYHLAESETADNVYRPIDQAFQHLDVTSQRIRGGRPRISLMTYDGAVKPQS